MGQPKSIHLSHNRDRCIGCGVCARIAPDRWIMNEKDGKAGMLGGRKRGGTFVTRILPFEVEENRRAAEECPVNVIHLHNA